MRCAGRIVGGEEVLARAFPLIGERVSADTLRYVFEDPHDPEVRDQKPPYDAWHHTRHMTHKLMRLAYEDGEDWLVGVLEPAREQAAAQAAFALVLEREAGVRPVRG